MVTDKIRRFFHSVSGHAAESEGVFDPKQFRHEDVKNDPLLKTFCALPWMHYFVSEMGNNYPCCISTDTELPNRNGAGDRMRVDTPGAILESWNSGYMRDIRTKMLSGKRPAPCVRCFKFEDLGIVSHRFWANEKYARYATESVRETQTDGTAPMRLYSADIRLGNQCNLRCRMCSPVSSKGLVADWQRLYKIKEKEAHRFLSCDWFENPEFWEMFDRHSQDLVSLHFAGGEPFIIKQHFTFLKSLIERGISRRITLSYNTNLTVLPEELLELWKSFERVQVIASLDGTEKVNRYIRYPSNWQQIQKNIRFVHDHFEEFNIYLLDFNVTVQTYNIHNIPELVDFLITEYPRATPPTLSLLFGPAELSIQVLPESMKRELTRKLSEYLDSRREMIFRVARWRNHAENLVKNIEGIISFMNAKDESHLLPKFVKRTQIFDIGRKQSCAEWIPELAALFPESKSQDLPSIDLSSKNIDGSPCIR